MSIEAEVVRIFIDRLNDLLPGFPVYELKSNTVEKQDRFAAVETGLLKQEGPGIPLYQLPFAIHLGTRKRATAATRTNPTSMKHTRRSAPPTPSAPGSRSRTGGFWPAWCRPSPNAPKMTPTTHGFCNTRFSSSTRRRIDHGR